MYEIVFDFLLMFLIIFLVYLLFVNKRKGDFSKLKSGDIIKILTLYYNIWLNCQFIIELIQGNKMRKEIEYVNSIRISSINQFNLNWFQSINQSEYLHNQSQSIRISS